MQFLDTLQLVDRVKRDVSGALFRGEKLAASSMNCGHVKTKIC